MAPGGLLLSVDEGEKHTLTVWDWRQDQTVARTSVMQPPLQYLTHLITAVHQLHCTQTHRTFREITFAR